MSRHAAGHRFPPRNAGTKSPSKTSARPPITDGRPTVDCGKRGRQTRAVFTIIPLVAFAEARSRRFALMLSYLSSTLARCQWSISSAELAFCVTGRQSSRDWRSAAAGRARPEGVRAGGRGEKEDADATPNLTVFGSKTPQLPLTVRLASMSSTTNGCPRTHWFLSRSLDSSRNSQGDVHAVT